MKNLYYELTEKGYHIYDKNDALFHIHQYEPYIPNKSVSYEENAKQQIHGIMVDEYSSLVQDETLTMEDVPTEYKEEVQAILDSIEDYEKAYKIVVGEIA